MFPHSFPNNSDVTIVCDFTKIVKPFLKISFAAARSQIEGDGGEVVLEGPAELPERRFQALDEALGVLGTGQHLLHALQAELLARAVLALGDAIGDERQDVPAPIADDAVLVDEIGDPVGDGRRVHDDLVDAQRAL